MSETLKEKIEWMLMGLYLTDKGAKEKRLFAYSIDLEERAFYCVKINDVKKKNAKKNYFDQNLPLEDIDENMEILVTH
ncbi:hypothetical protein MKX47_21290 [Solibacillus sp. FSL R7-0668]|uniref:hypothetical protein n=1 Tax=Solibacillus sp. FSL R7-0668 TaxID=2921688 RepID=UPI0030FC4662